MGSCIVPEEQRDRRRGEDRGKEQPQQGAEKEDGSAMTWRRQEGTSSATPISLPSKSPSWSCYSHHNRNRSPHPSPSFLFYLLLLLPLLLRPNNLTKPDSCPGPTSHPQSILFDLDLVVVMKWTLAQYPNAHTQLLEHHGPKTYCDFFLLLFFLNCLQRYKRLTTKKTLVTLRSNLYMKNTKYQFEFIFDIFSFIMPKKIFFSPYFSFFYIKN